MKKKQLNEATLEARISSILKKTFPTFSELKVKHQESFSLKFGHHNVIIDNKKPSNNPNRAIYDILLTTEDEKTNLILLELKKEGKKITDEDIEQGISYARLIHPMPPITLLSNGKEHLFFDTYSKSVIEKDTIDFDFIQKRIANNFALASNDFKKTIEILLSKNPKILSQIINNISKKRFEYLKGEITDLTKPICDEFVIRRDYVDKIEHNCKEKNLIGIIGSALSGKTNILYDYFVSYQNYNNAIFYMDCRENNYSIFQQIANHLTKELGYHITKEKVKEWFISSTSNTDVSFKFILDNYDETISQNIKEEVTELIDILEGSNHTIIFTIDLINYEIIAKDKFRNYLTLFGKKTFLIKITELNIEEFNKCQKDLFKVCKCFFEPGAHFAVEYRQPRILRLLASSFKKGINTIPKDAGFKIIAVPDYELLKIFAENNSFSTELRELYKKLTEAFLKDRLNKTSNWILSLSSHYGGISLSSIKDVFKEDVANLFKSSFVTKHELQRDLIVVYPKIPELIAYYGIEYISDLLIAEYKNKEPIKKIYESFENLCMPFVNNDNVGTGVLLEIAKLGYIDLFSELVLHLKTLKPSKEKINDGTKIAMLLDEKIKVNIEFQGDDFEEGFIANFFPYLVLSQLAGYPLRLETSEEGQEYSFHLQLLMELANNPITILRISNFSFDNIPQIESIEVGKITVLSGHNGIIEPIVQSIQKCFYLIPEEIERLYEFALRNDLFLVIWRIYLAIRNETNSVDKKISTIAKKILNKFDKKFPTLFKKLVIDNNNNNNKG